MVKHRSVRSIRNPASAVHGTVLAGALIAVQGAKEDPDISDLVTLVLITQVVYWLAHVYAETVGDRIAAGTGPRRPLRELLSEEWPVVAVSFGPIAVIVACSALGVSANAAVWWGLMATIALMGGWALLAGYRSGLSATERLVYLGISLALGLALVGLKAVLH